MKKCIFYLPYKLEEKAMGARMMRPRKMIQAFKDIGYDVEVITGTSSERRSLIKKVKEQIAHGEKFDFMYTEAHTEPTLLTDPHHLPTHPFLDYSFFKYLHKKKINIGLFYPDVYWRYKTYGINLPRWKKHGAILCYKYDIHQYEKYLKVFYVPNKRILSSLKNKYLENKARELPPGSDENVALQFFKETNHFGEGLSLLYIGGLGGHYQIAELCKAIKMNPKCRLTICCRVKEWETEKNNLMPFLCERITVVHKSGDELEDLYKSADICSLMFSPDYYVEMAIPYKAFEYLAHEKPMISTEGTAIGDFVQDNGVGWAIPYNYIAIGNLLQSIIENPTAIEDIIGKCREVKHKNTWKMRAIKVANELI